MTVSGALNPAILIFDADNTLWDTNAVFRGAQMAMLRPFADRVPGFSVAAEIATLREVDRLLFQRLGKFEYDFRLLAEALAHHYLHDCPAQDAACRAIEGTSSYLAPDDVALVEQAYRDYASALREIPPLLPDTRAVLNILQEARSQSASLALTLFSEGNPDRLGHILDYHGLAGENVFHATHIGPKTSESFARFRELGQGFLGQVNGGCSTTLVVGDSLKREIKCGNQIGATTIYIPAGFMGAEQPTVADEKPDHVLVRLGELPALMRDLLLIA